MSFRGQFPFENTARHMKIAFRWTKNGTSLGASDYIVCYLAIADAMMLMPRKLLSREEEPPLVSDPFCSGVSG